MSQLWTFFPTTRIVYNLCDIYIAEHPWKHSL